MNQLVVLIIVILLPGILATIISDKVAIVSTILCKLRIRVNGAAPCLPDLFSNSIPFSAI